MTRNEDEVEGDGEGDDARVAWEEEEQQGLKMVEMKDLDLRRCLVTCLRGSIMDWINGIRIFLLSQGSIDIVCLCSKCLCLCL